MPIPSTQWWTSPLNSISNFLFPPLPSGAPSNPQTQAYGILGAFGSALTAASPTYAYGTNVAGVVGSIAGGELGSGISGSITPTLSQSSTPLGASPVGALPTPTPPTPPTTAAPVYGQPSPTAIRSPLGGTEGGGVGTTEPAPTAEGRESDSAFRAGNQAAAVIQQPKGTNAYGYEGAPTWISGAEQQKLKATDQQMIDAGYVKDANGNWVLSGSTAGNITGNTPPASTANAYWRTSGSNFGQTGWQGQVHGQRFGSEQAYNSWVNRQKRSSKKEEDEQLKKAQATVTSSFGTG